MLLMNVFFEIAIGLYTYRNQEIIVAYLGEEYPGYSINSVTAFLVIATVIDTLVNLVQYFFGFLALFTHKVTNFQTFNFMLLFCMFLRVFMIYINFLNLVMLLIKMVTYLYSRFTLTLLLSVLVAPRQR